MIFEKKNWLKKTAEREVLVRFNSDITKINDLTKNRLYQIQNYGETPENVIAVLTESLTEIENITNDNIEYTKNRYVNISKAEDLNIILSEKIEILSDLKETLNRENESLRERVESLLVENVKLKETLELSKKVEEIFGLLENNIKSIAVSKIMRDKTSPKVDNRKKSVNEELLIKLYDNGNSGLTNEEIGRQVGLTGNGVRFRLEQLGLYVSKRK